VLRHRPHHRVVGLGGAQDVVAQLLVRGGLGLGAQVRGSLGLAVPPGVKRVWLGLGLGGGVQG